MFLTGRPDELEKNRPKDSSPTQFLSKVGQKFCGGKSGTKIWATSVISRKLPKFHKQTPKRRKFAQSSHTGP
jgi:hypothetical protein